MTYYFSPSDNIFLPAKLKPRYEAAGTWPDDAVEVADEVYQEFGAGQAPDGKRRGVEDGLPVWEDIPPPTLEEARTRKLAELRQACDAATADLKAPYSDTERLTWERQERQARAFMDDNQAVTPLMDELAAKRGLERPEMAQKIITKANAFEAAAAEAIGTQQALEDVVKAATTVAEIEAVEWPTAS